MKLHLNLVVALVIGSVAFVAAAHTPEQHAPPSRSLQIKPFNEETWVKLLKTGPRPAAYMFTTSYCSACPAVFQEVRDATSKSRTRPELIVVMMDGHALPPGSTPFEEYGPANSGALCRNRKQHSSA